MNLTILTTENRIEREIYPQVSFFNLNESLQMNYDLLIIANNTLDHIESFNRLKNLTKTILIEKPLSHNAESILASGVLEYKGEQFVSSQIRFYSSYPEMQQSMKDLGRILKVSIECLSWLPNWRPGRNTREGYWSDPVQGGVVRDLVHELDYCTQLFGFPSKVRCSVNQNFDLLNSIVDSEAFIEWGTTICAEISVHLSYSHKIAKRSAYIEGEKGSLEWNLLTGEVTLIHAKSTVVDKSITPTSQIQALEAQLEAVFDNTLHYKLASKHEGFKVVCLVDALLLSAKINEEVEVNYFGQV